MAAAFENKTIGEIRELIINSFQNAFNKTFRLLPKSFIKVIASVFAAVYIILHKQIAWLFLQLFPETAYRGTVNILGIKVRPLVKWGVLIGVGEPRSGSRWRGKITVKVSHNGSALVAGTQLTGDITGKLYITEEGAALDSETALVPVVCADAGTADNLESGDTLGFVSPLGAVEKTAAVFEVTSYAVEDESEAEYRARVASRFRSPPMGGALRLSEVGERCARRAEYVPLQRRRNARRRPFVCRGHPLAFPRPRANAGLIAASGRGLHV
jgi:uncharacterized phage protein gp47/JayE